MHSERELLWCELIPFGTACLLLGDCGYGVADRAILPEFERFFVRALEAEIKDIFYMLVWFEEQAAEV
ncbi:hypothetical protein ACWPKO_18125 [Coraliomargarita sp. W4R53]